LISQDGRTINQSVKDAGEIMSIILNQELVVEAILLMLRVIPRRILMVLKLVRQRV
jgi:hypothetical protein